MTGRHLQDLRPKLFGAGRAAAREFRSGISPTPLPMEET